MRFVTTASAHLARGLALEREGDLAGAVREHEAAIAADPELAQAHVNLISLYGRQQQWARADAAYREALRLGYRGADAHYNHGVALVLQGRDADAAVAFEQAVAANPQHAAAWNNLGGSPSGQDGSTRRLPGIGRPWMLRLPTRRCGSTLDAC